MTRAYIKFDPTFDQRKAHYTDGQYRAFVAVLCHAAFQPRRGHFRDLRYLKALLGRHARHVQFLLNQHDIELSIDAEGLEVVRIPGWDEWQEGDLTVADRVARIRARRRAEGVRKRVLKGDSLADANGDANGGRNGDPDSDVTEGLTVPPVTSRYLSNTLNNVNTTQTHNERPLQRGDPPPKGVAADEELANRARAILEDPDAPDWKKEAAEQQLRYMKEL